MADDGYEFWSTPRFKKKYSKKTERQQQAVKKCVKRLAKDPRHPGLHTHKIQGPAEAVFESYVDRANRVTWHWDEGRIALRNNCTHDILERSP